MKGSRTQGIQGVSRLHGGLIFAPAKLLVQKWVDPLWGCSLTWALTWSASQILQSPAQAGRTHGGRKSPYAFPSREWSKGSCHYPTSSPTKTLGESKSLPKFEYHCIEWSTVWLSLVILSQSQMASQNLVSDSVNWRLVEVYNKSCTCACKICILLIVVCEEEFP